MLKRYYLLIALLFCVTTRIEGSDVRALKFTPIDFPGARITEAEGIDNLGQVVGTWEDPVTRASHGFVFSAGVYTSIDFPGALHTTASGINDDGDIVGTYYLSDASNTITAVRGYVRTAAGQFTSIAVPGKAVTGVYGINNLDQIVGTYFDVEGDQVLGVHGFVLTNGTFTTIDFPTQPSAGPMVTYAVGINDAGDIVGGYNDDDVFQTRRGYVLKGGVFRRFDVSGSLMTDLFGLNETGEIVGMYQDPKDGQFYSFLSSPKRGFRRLAMTGDRKRRLALMGTMDVNDGGQIAGSSFDGSLHGFIASPPPNR
jgi:uncharacterized membrane protein